MHSTIETITRRIVERSRDTRSAYLQRLERAAGAGPHRGILACGNLAHGLAACGTVDKDELSENTKANIGIVSAYNDMLSAHQPLGAYPHLIKQAAHEAGGVAQFAGGVPAMCDGVTQGPFPTIRFCPTSGIGESDLCNYLSLSNVVTVGGS